MKDLIINQLVYIDKEMIFDNYYEEIKENSIMSKWIQTVLDD